MVTVPVQISIYSAVKAVLQHAETSPAERMTQYMADDLRKAADRIDERIMALFLERQPATPGEHK